jgi:hypothetical protein
MNKEKYLSLINRYSIPLPLRKINLSETYDEEPNLPKPFYYQNKRFYHFDKDDLLGFFLMCDYKEVKFENSLTILKKDDEIIYIFTYPDNLHINIKIDPDEQLIKVEVECYSSFVFYKNKNEYIKLWKFEYVNELFKKWFAEYIKRFFDIPSYIR